ncbi:phage minor tail protein [Escherichia coli]|uniref:Phage minor tail protein n=1 Tax=Escherichia coli TaxID=562 RepID=A0A2X3LZA6_ECOLX|nr:phage minor tail protein [Escherichia coli]
MQDIRQETLNECTRAEQSASVVLWEIDLTEVGGERYFFCNEQNEKGEPVTWQGRQYQPYPIQGSGFELNGKGTSTRPTLTVSNLYGMVTGMAEDMQSLVGGTVVRRKVYARFLDAVNFVNGNSLRRSGAGGDQPLAHRAVQRTERGECLFCTVHADGNGRCRFSGAHHAGQHLHLDLSR